MLAPTFTWPRPPGSQPTMDLAKSKIWFVSPAAFMRFPARMKNGIASRGKLSTPLTMRWITAKSGTARVT